MKYLTILFGLLFLGAVAGAAPAAADTGQDHAVATVRAYLDTLEKAGFSGTVLVEYQGKVVLSQGYGYSDIEHGRKNTPRTVFDIGSITKQFTAAAIMKLEMQGKLSTADRLPRYFNNVPPDKAGITIHDLLRHASGLKSSIGGDYARITAAAFVDSVMKCPLSFPPGTAFSYSNIGYSLLGMIIEKVSGMPCERFLYQNLWHPAGMEQTGYRRPNFNPALIATGYHNDDRAWGKPNEKPWDEDAPFWHLKANGGILSTAEDLFRWNQALLSDRILAKEAKTRMFHPQLRPGEDSTAYYAYGWDVHRTPWNTTSYWHDGSNGIFYADFFRLVDDHTTVIVLTNKSNGFQSAGREIVKSLFSQAYTPIVPIADNERNRSFTDRLLEITTRQGIVAGADQLAKAEAGEHLLEERVNRLGYELLQEGKTKEAIDVFRLNVQAFPASANAYDSLGEACLAAGDTALAIANYAKSLALDSENLNAAQLLQRLKGQ